MDPHSIPANTWHERFVQSEIRRSLDVAQKARLREGVTQGLRNAIAAIQTMNTVRGQQQARHHIETALLWLDGLDAFGDE